MSNNLEGIELTTSNHIAHIQSHTFKVLTQNGMAYIDIPHTLRDFLKANVADSIDGGVFLKPIVGCVALVTHIGIGYIQ